MFSWITANLGTIVVAVILAAVIAAIVIKMVKNKI